MERESRLSSPNMESNSSHPLEPKTFLSFQLSPFERYIERSAVRRIKKLPIDIQPRVIERFYRFLFDTSTGEIGEDEIWDSLRSSVLVPQMAGEVFHTKLDLAVELSKVVKRVIDPENQEKIFLLSSDWLFPTSIVEETITLDDYLENISVSEKTNFAVRKTISLLGLRWQSKFECKKDRYVGVSEGDNEQKFGTLVYREIFHLPSSPKTLETFLRSIRILSEEENVNLHLSTFNQRDSILREFFEEMKRNYEHVRAYMKLPLEVRKRLGISYPGKSDAEVIKLVAISSSINTALFIAGKGADYITYLLANNPLFIESTKYAPKGVVAGAILGLLLAEGTLIYSEIENLSNRNVEFTTNPIVTALHHVFGFTPFSSVVIQRILSRTFGEVGNLPLIIGLSAIANQDVLDVWIANKLVSAGFYFSEAGINFAIPHIQTTLNIIKSKPKDLFGYNRDNKNI